ncbi:MAG: hypothetical protein ACO2OR_00730 [Desulfurococcaceae archaeon]
MNNESLVSSLGLRVGALQEVYSHIVRGVSRLRLFLLLWIVLSIVAAVLLAVVVALSVFLIMSSDVSTAKLATSVTIATSFIIGSIVPLLVYMRGVAELSKWSGVFKKYGAVAVVLLVLSAIKIPLALAMWLYLLDAIAEPLKTALESGALPDIDTAEISGRFCAEWSLLCLSDFLIGLVVSILSIVLVGVLSTIRGEIGRFLAATSSGMTWRLAELGRLNTATLLLRVELLISLLTSVAGHPAVEHPALTLLSWLSAVVNSLPIPYLAIQFILFIAGVVLGYTGLSRVKNLVVVLSASAGPSTAP